MKKWKYYVYKFHKNGVCVYVGKGSGNRFAAQKRRFVGCNGYISAYFMDEESALVHENSQILDIAPAFNKAQMPKDAKPWLKILLPEKDIDFYSWCESIGKSQIALRVLLSRDWREISKYGVDVKQLLSKLDPWCEELNGLRA